MIIRISDVNEREGNPIRAIFAQRENNPIDELRKWREKWRDVMERRNGETLWRDVMERRYGETLWRDVHPMDNRVPPRSRIYPRENE